MSKTIIPAKEILTCDCCGRVCGAGPDDAPRRQEGRFVLHQHALDWSGAPVTDGTVSRDLCDNCLSKIAKAVNDVCMTVRATQAENKTGGAE